VILIHFSKFKNWSYYHGTVAYSFKVAMDH
jgi:hypothetical protein